MEWELTKQFDNNSQVRFELSCFQQHFCVKNISSFPIIDCGTFMKVGYVKHLTIYIFFSYTAVVFYYS